MTITLDIPKATEQKLQEEAKRAGLAVAEYALQLIDKGLESEDEWVRTLKSGHVSTGVSLTDEQTRREALYDN